MLHLHRRPLPPASSAETSLSPESLLSGAVQLAREALTLGGARPSVRSPGVEPEAAAWAVLGAVERDQVLPHAAVLERLFASQRADGELPGVLQQSPAPRLKAWWRRAARTTTTAARNEGEAVLGRRRQALLVWACAEMAVRTGDTEACRRWRGPLEAAVAWLERQPCTGRVDIAVEALAHQARMALGHLSILLGDAVTGARHWAAAAAAKGRIETAIFAPVPPADHLWAWVVGAAGPLARPVAVAREGKSSQAGLAAWAAAQAGDTDGARRMLLEAAQEALALGRFESCVSAGLFLRGVACWRCLTEQCVSASAPVPTRQWKLSEDEARILSVC